MDQPILDQKLGAIGEVKFELKDGMLIGSLEISPKIILDSIAAKIGGPIPAEIALFIESAFGLK